MSRVRILGLARELESTLCALQELAVVHLDAPRAYPSLHHRQLSDRERRRIAQLRSVLADIETAREQVGPVAGSSQGRGTPPALPDLARAARRVRRAAESSSRRYDALKSELGGLAKARAALAGWESVVAVLRSLTRARAYFLTVRDEERQVIAALEDQLRQHLGEDFVLRSRDLPGPETALVLIVPEARAGPVEDLLSKAGVRSLPLPVGLAERPLAEVIPRLDERLAELSRDLARLEQERDELRQTIVQGLAGARRRLHDLVLRIEALEESASTGSAFVLEGWLPKASVARLVETLQREVGPTVSVELASNEDWEETPVALRNPRIFRPFEAITRMLPLPRYGTIDATPFVAVFFPMFFGLMLGDLGYGAMLGLGALALRFKSEPDSPRRALSEVAGACALFAMLFGLLFGELFGDLGRRWLGLKPLAFAREEALLPFLGLTLALGFVHILLGLVLGAIASFRRSSRQSLGRGLAAVIVVLVAVGLLAALDILPDSFFDPVVVLLLVVFPVLVAVEGIVAPVELLSTLGHVLSYARIMALGTASVMLAIIANRLVGAMGSVLVGVVFGLLFHLVNFLLGVLGPTIHALRLHYVEFFGKFYSPGGVEYRPFAPWRPSPVAAH